MESFVQAVTAVNNCINNFVWGPPMLALIICTGIYLTVRSRFFQITKAREVADKTFFAIFKKESVRKTQEHRAITQFQALSTALAATIGTGNIAGVATAISVGGAGAVFWMWLSAFFGMMTNYAENVLGIYFRKKNPKGEWTGGAMYYIENGFKQKKHLSFIAKPLAVIFSVFCVLASFGIGNMTQVNSIASAMQDSFGIEPLATGIVIAVLIALVIIGGIKRIGSVTEKIVPFMAFAYIVGAFAILVINAQHIPAVFSSIFAEAFGFRAAAGGFAGAALKNAMTMGFKRGVFSNEAGLGSSVMVHSASDVKEPVVQGMWGIFEVFFDTIIVCTLTAFAVLSTGVIGSGANGVPLVSAAFSHGFGKFAGQFISLAVLLFAFSTVLGWSFYGEKAMEYLFGTRAAIVYKLIFVCFIIVGATMNLGLAWDIADTLNGLMAIPNLIGVLALSGTVIAVTGNYKARRLSKTPQDIEPMLSAYSDIQAEQKAKLNE
ncbi:MAG: sodium:alanine symporter family protein [Bacteroides sp.]|nr:sodium:alanine symporter family protein [Prevotella sp.]MCM1408854.1 sodium:alanine symporter family protein [Treponema brennaborense]MCM1470786.1 sodium:alanine symporter family protein [Bacteroides sp.]